MMNLRKKLSAAVALALCTAALSGCGAEKPAETIPVQASTTMTEAPVPATETQASSELLRNLYLELPENIARESTSAMRDHFYVDGNIVGGIALLDMGNALDNNDLESCSQQAVAITKEVYDTNYDYMADSDSVGQVVVGLGSQDGKEYQHYFFSGKEMDYDVWMDIGVLDAQDMNATLKTLQSDDILVPEESSTDAPPIPPILNLHADMPEGFMWIPTLTTRVVFYQGNNFTSGENVVGGVEQVAEEMDEEMQLSFTSALAAEYMDGDFTSTMADAPESSLVYAKVTANSADRNTVHFFIQVGEETYDVWADTAILSEDALLKIAESCKY